MITHTEDCTYNGGIVTSANALACPKCMALYNLAADALLGYEDAPELPQDPTGVDCIERYEGGDE